MASAPSSIHPDLIGIVSISSLKTVVKVATSQQNPVVDATLSQSNLVAATKEATTCRFVTDIASNGFVV